MDLTGRLRAWVLARPRVLLLEAVGGTGQRLAAEDALRRRAWPRADHPADADMLVVCGAATPALAPSIERLRAGMAHPAASVLIGGASGGGFDRHGEDVARVLDDAAALLRQRAREGPPPPGRDDAEPGEDGHGAAQAGGGGHDNGQHGDGDGDHHGHEGHHAHEGHHGHGDMAPGGLEMASRAEDRDGLKLDVLDVPFGVGSFGWPPLLRVVLTLQGDVVQDARVETLAARAEAGAGSWWERPWRAALAGEATPVPEAERWRAAAHLDSLGRFLDVAGHRDAARAARHLRDRCLAGSEAAGLRGEARALARAVRRGGLLERATAGTGVLAADHARRIGVGGPALRAAGCAEDLRTGSDAYPGFAPVCATGEGDVRARWLQWLAEIDHALGLADRHERRLLPAARRHEAPRGRIGHGMPPPSQGLIAAIAALVVGQTLAAARLTIASLDPDGNDAGKASDREPAHGG